MRTAPRVTLALVSALVLAGAVSAAPARDDQDPPAAVSSREAPPSRAGDTPSSSGSGATAAPTAPSGSATGQPDDRRGDARHRAGSNSGGSGGGHGHGGGHWGGYYGPGYYPYGHWAWWGTWWPGYVYYDGPYVSRRREEAGALDIDVSPGKTEVWVDGNYVGTADDFDGFPTFLWLPADTYDVAFYREGYRTLTRQYTIYAGLIIDVEDHLEPGESIRPEALASKSTERRDARLQRDRELAAEVDARERSREQSWRERRESASPAVGVDSGSARVILRLSPPDASVYLDGRFLGTAEDLGRLPNGFAVEPGEHELEVVRPGYAAARQVVGVEAGEVAELDLALEAVVD